MEQIYAERTHVYWKRGREKYLSYVDFSRLCNVINQFPDLSIDIFTDVITFTL